MVRYSEKMNGQCHSKIWLIIVLALFYRTATAQVCNNPESQVKTTNLLTASSTDPALNVNYGILNCCNGQRYISDVSLGGWCPATNQNGAWYDVRFTSAVNVTTVILQPPYLASAAAPPAVAEFQLLYEDTRDPQGVLTNYTFSTNGTHQEVIKAVYNNGQFVLNLTSPVVARRIRILVVNFTDRPCLRMDIKGCPVDIAPPDFNVPVLTFDETSSRDNMRLKCRVSNQSYFAIDYLVTWYRDAVKIQEEKLTNDLVTSYLNVSTGNFSSGQKHTCYVQTCYLGFCKDNATLSRGNSSDTYAPDIVITNTKQLDISEGETKFVSLRATAPPYLLCAAAGQQFGCDITIVSTSIDDNATVLVRDMGKENNFRVVDVFNIRRVICIMFNSTLKPDYYSKLCPNSDSSSRQQVPCQEEDALLLPHLLFSNDISTNENYAVTCAIKLTENNWNQDLSIGVTLNSGTHLSGSYQSTIKVEAVLGSLLHGYNKTIRVNSTFFRQTAVCELNGLSHLRTFQGSRFDNIENGEFILYKHTQLPFEAFADLLGQNQILLQQTLTLGDADFEQFFYSTSDIPGNCIDGDSLVQFNVSKAFTLGYTTGPWTNTSARSECEREVNLSAARNQCSLNLLEDSDYTNCMIDIVVNETGYSILDMTPRIAQRTLYVTSSIVYCSLPSPDDYLISIKNSRGLISNSEIFISYNPSCEECFSSGRCSKKANTCNISGKCYNHLDLNPENHTLFCNATNDALHWSRITESSKRQKDLLVSPSVNAIFRGPYNDTFICKYQMLSDPLLKYDVIWAVNGMWNYDATDQDDSAVLSKNVSSKLQYNDTLQCAISVYRTGLTEEFRGPLTLSDIYKVEIQILNWKDITLYEGDTSEALTIKATAPPYVLCRHLGSGSESCHINIDISLSNPVESLCPNGTSIPQAVVAIRKNFSEINSCGIQLTNIDWQSIYTVQIKATTDLTYDGNHNLGLNLTKEFIFNGSSHSHQSHSAIVNVIDKDTDAVCSSINDPHITSFDGRLTHNFLEGELVFYKHTTLPYEVRLFFRRCAGAASCNCAVAAKAGDDVIVIDKCGPFKNSTTDNFFPMTVKLYRNGKMTPGFRIISRYEGRHYEIIYPTGTVLEVFRSAIKGYNYINVWLKPSPADVGLTTGLCGILDGNKTNDLIFPNGTLYEGTSDQPMEYFQSWRKNQSDTLYTGSCDTVAVENQQINYCYCEKNGTGNCGYSFDVITCPYFKSGQTDITERLISQALFPMKCLENSSSSVPFFEYDTNVNSV
ncbi:hypothetical protein Btru_047520, partial [Bulinus truncatus]